MGWRETLKKEKREDRPFPLYANVDFKALNQDRNSNSNNPIKAHMAVSLPFLFSCYVAAASRQRTLAFLLTNISSFKRNTVCSDLTAQRKSGVFCS